MPVRIFDVSNRIGRLIGQAANNERDQPKPLETALCYGRLRAALAEESGGHPVGVRKLVGIGWHRRTMAHAYLTVAESLTPDVLRSAGVLDEHGQAPAALVTKLSLAALLGIAKLDSPDELVEALRVAADRARGVKSGGPKLAPAAPSEISAAERLAQVREVDGISVRVRRPVRTLTPAEAWRIVTQELMPAMVALVEQGQGATAGVGYLGEFADDHAVLVVPREVEQLSAVQLRRLAEDVSGLPKRVRRVARFRDRRPSTARGQADAGARAALRSAGTSTGGGQPGAVGE